MVGRRWLPTKRPSWPDLSWHHPEHLLLQNVTAFFNVGDHNNIRLEGADWNDASDLAPEKGETVAFTSFYAGNLLELTGLLEALRDRLNLETVELATEMMILFDSLYDQLDYDSVSAKRTLLANISTPASTRWRAQKLGCRSKI